MAPLRVTGYADAMNGAPDDNPSVTLRVTPPFTQGRL